MSESEIARLREDALALARQWGCAALLVLYPPPSLAPLPFVGLWDAETAEAREAGERVPPEGEG